MGALPAQMHIDLDDKVNFKLIPVEGVGEKILFSKENEQHTAQVSLEPRQEAHMMVVFAAKEPGTFQGMISVTVLDNEFENLKCHLIAEHRATVSLVNLPPVPLDLQVQFSFRGKKYQTFTLGKFFGQYAVVRGFGDQRAESSILDNSK